MILLAYLSLSDKAYQKPVIKNGQWIYQSDPYSRRTNVRNQKNQGLFRQRFFPGSLPLYTSIGHSIPMLI